MTTEITVTINEEKNGIEIKFAKKPTLQILSDLKAKKFRWSHLGLCWYTKYSDEIWEYANSLK